MEPIPKPEGAEFSDLDWQSAVGAVRAYCGWHVAPSVTEEVTVDGSGGSVQFLPTLYLTGVQGVTADGRVVSDPEWSQHGMLRGVRSCRFRGVVATITHGYDSFPVEVEAVARDMASSAGRTGASGMLAGPYQVTYPSGDAGREAGVVGMSGMQRAVLDRYRLAPRP